jgi:dihydrofolate synthase/folylpolyglutamate synthase
LPAVEDGGPPLGLPGTFQRANAAVAVGMAMALRQAGWAISEEALRRGLRQAHWPGRLERRAFRGRTLLLDGAHNPPGAAALRGELDRLEPPDPVESAPAQRGTPARRWLLAIQRTKEAPALLDALLHPNDAAAIVALRDLPCWSVEDLLAARPGLQGRLRPVDRPLEGLEWLVAGGDGLPVVAGSLHLLGEIWDLLDSPSTPPADTADGQHPGRLLGLG